MLRTPEERACVGRLDDLAGVHHLDPVAEAGHHGEVVRDEQHRHAGLALEFLDQGEDLRLHRDVERGGRLVGDEDVRAA